MLTKSTFENIGFPISNTDEIFDLFNQIKPLSKVLEFGGNKFYFYEDGEINLIFAFDENSDFLSVEPHFKSKNFFELGLEYLILNKETQEGLFYAWIDPDETITDGLAPFTFYYPYFFKFNQSKLPFKTNVALSAFPYEIYFYTSEEDFAENNNSEMLLSSEYFIPVGLFEETYIPVVQFAGKIEKISEKRNSLTGEKFYELSVKSLITLTVLVSERLTNKKTKVGAILDGTFFLSGELENY